jgi:hypothetical protein
MIYIYIFLSKLNTTMRILMLSLNIVASQVNNFIKCTVYRTFRATLSLIN